MAKFRSNDEAAALCPCGSGRRYGACCKPLHDGAPAADAEALMRSRYSAFALDLDEYIQRSWHGSTRPAANTIAEKNAAPKWIGLQIKRHTSVDAEHALVEFIARYKINGRACALHEISRFVRENGNWYYLDGEQSN